MPFLSVVREESPEWCFWVSKKRGNGREWRGVMENKRRKRRKAK